MSYGIERWGIGSWGGSDFIVTNHVPPDNSTGISRTPTISFALISQSGNILVNTINLIANNIPLIVNGTFTANATGTINISNPTNVIVTANVIHAFSPFTTVTVAVDAQNAAMAHPASGITWQFVVNNIIGQFSNYIMRKFERVFRVNAVGPLSPPQNPHAIIELNPPPNLSGTVI
jgi:hypothetical protein